MKTLMHSIQTNLARTALPIFVGLSLSSTIGHAAGGFNGGDGGDPLGTLGQRLTVNEMESLIQDSRPTVVAFFNGVSALYDMTSQQIQKRGTSWAELERQRSDMRQMKSFGAKIASIENFLVETDKVEIVLRDSCRDSAGQAKTAVMARKGGSSRLCVNVRQLIRQTDSSNARVQVQSLMVHEVSHAFGATEEEAQWLQKMAAASLTDKSYRTDASGNFFRVSRLVGPVEIQTERWEKLSETLAKMKSEDLACGDRVAAKDAFADASALFELLGKSGFTDLMNGSVLSIFSPAARREALVKLSGEVQALKRMATAPDEEFCRSASAAAKTYKSWDTDDSLTTLYWDHFRMNSSEFKIEGLPYRDWTKIL